VPRPPWKLLAPLAGGFVLAQILLLPGEGFAEEWKGQGGSPSELLGWKGGIEILLVALVGRILLSWLPAGVPGSHHPRDLPVTWAASHLVGFFALVAERRFYPGASTAACLLPWLLLAGLRLATLPASMVPRRDLPHERAPRLARYVRWVAALSAVAWILLALDLPRPPGDLFAAASDRALGPVLPLTTVGWLALWILVHHALGDARRAPLGRAILFLVLATTPAPLLVSLPGALALGLGAVFLIPWVRRADRRAGALSAIGFSVLGLFGQPVLALAGLGALVLASNRVQRRFALAAGLASAAVVVLATGIDRLSSASPASGPDWAGLGSLALDLGRWGLLWFVFLPTIAWAPIALLRAKRAHDHGEIDDVERELRALLALTALVLGVLLPRTRGVGVHDALVYLFPIAVLMIGLTWIRTERPEPPG